MILCCVWFCVCVCVWYVVWCSTCQQCFPQYTWHKVVHPVAIPTEVTKVHTIFLYVAWNSNTVSCTKTLTCLHFLNVMSPPRVWLHKTNSNRVGHVLVYLSTLLWFYLVGNTAFPCVFYNNMICVAYQVVSVMESSNGEVDLVDLEQKLQVWFSTYTYMCMCIQYMFCIMMFILFVYVHILHTYIHVYIYIHTDVVKCY